jgi:nitrogen fixation protein FixH
MSRFSNCSWVPWAIAGALGVVVAANVALAYFAAESSTGLVSEHPFESGNGYNRVLDAGAAQDVLGWRAALRFAPSGPRRGEVTAEFVDAAGRPLSGLQVTAEVVRPIEPLPAQGLALGESGAGRSSRHGGLLLRASHR